MCQQSIFAIYFHLLVQDLIISVSLKTGVSARVAVQGDGTLN